MREEVEFLKQQETIIKPLIQRALVERLKVNETTLWRNRENPDFSEWTRKLDPDGIAWEYRPAKKGLPQYYPITQET